MARWGRAIAALPFRAGRVLDLGCAFGFSTLRLAKRGYSTVGVDNSPRYIEMAKRRHPQGEYLLSTAEKLPLPDGSFDGVICLDVLEHVVNEQAVIDEIKRVLKQGGILALSVPNKRLLAWLDSLNLYAWLVRVSRHGSLPPEIMQAGKHRHYSIARLRQLLGPDFRIEQVQYTGLGLAELINLPLLVACRFVVSWERLYAILQYGYFLAYLLEDLLPMNRAGYHLMLVATKVVHRTHSETSQEQAATPAQA